MNGGRSLNASDLVEGELYTPLSDWRVRLDQNIGARWMTLSTIPYGSPLMFLSRKDVPHPMNFGTGVHMKQTTEYRWLTSFGVVVYHLMETDATTWIQKFQKL